jgi:hypothetical protein
MTKSLNLMRHPCVLLLHPTSGLHASISTVFYLLILLMNG